MNKPLAGRKIAVVVEHKFIPEELEAYRFGFGALGAEVQFVSRIWYGGYKPGHPHWTEPVFWSDVDPGDNLPWQTPVAVKLDGKADVSALHIADYAAIIMTANYTSMRLLYSDLPASADPRAYVQSAPVPRFFAEAMKDPHVIKGALCHGLLVLTPYPELLKGRHITCHTVVMAPVLNTGADVRLVQGANGQYEPEKVVQDGDLITAYSKKEIPQFVDQIAAAVASLKPRPPSP